MQIPESLWFKSSRSGQTTECVEAALPGNSVVGVRDSKAPHQAHLEISSGAWTSFLSAVKSGERDRPAA